MEFASLNVTKVLLTPGDAGNLVSTFTISNITKERLAFKVKTTAPKCYVVKPNQGVIEPGAGQKAHIAITLQTAASKAVRIALMPKRKTTRSRTTASS